jgi:hypothetical protein
VPMKRCCPKCRLTVEVEPGPVTRTYACPDCATPIEVPGTASVFGVQPPGRREAVLTDTERIVLASERTAKAVGEIRNLIAALLILGLIIAIISAFHD